MKENVKQREEEVSRKTLDEFLNSMTFTEAARISCTNLTKAAIYKELKKLSKIYPFNPRRCGFVEIPKSSRCAAILPGFTWGAEKDKMQNAQGKIVKPLWRFENAEPGMIPCPWKRVFHWLVDINITSKRWIKNPGEEEEEEKKEESEGEQRDTILGGGGEIMIISQILMPTYKLRRIFPCKRGGGGS